MEQQRLVEQQTAVNRKHRVLVVDDDRPVLDAIETYLITHGFDVDTASEREEAEALLSTKSYSLLISDLRLTGIHGREGLEVLRVAREHCPLARIIMITGYGTPELEMEICQYGSDILLEKPIPLSQLVDVARDLLRDLAPQVFQVFEE